MLAKLACAARRGQASMRRQHAVGTPDSQLNTRLRGQRESHMYLPLHFALLAVSGNFAETGCAMRSTQPAGDAAGWPVMFGLTRSGRPRRSGALAARRSLRPLGVAGLAAAILAWPVPLAASTGVRSLAGDTLCGSGPFTASATPGDSQATVSWCALVNPDASYSYNVYEGTGPGGESESPVNGSPIQSTTYQVPGLTNGTTYYFTVEAVESVNSKPVGSTLSNEVQATPVSATTVPGAPTGLVATPGDSVVRLTWTAPGSDGGTPITEYEVWQGTSPGGETRPPVALSTGTSATVSGLTDGARYYFVVTAVNADGDGPSSNEASAIPAVGQPGSSSPSSSPSASPSPTRSSRVGHHRRHHVASTSSRASWLIILLGFAGVVAAAAGVVVRAARRRGPRAPPHEPTVRAERNGGPPGKVAVHSTGSRPTISVRIEPQPGARTITIKETRQ
jgi:hypothetical protein